jgi:hypothetical protein
MRVLDFNRLRVARAMHATRSAPVASENLGHEEEIDEVALGPGELARLLNARMLVGGFMAPLERWDLDVQGGDIPTRRLKQMFPKLIQPGYARLTLGPSEIASDVFSNRILVSSLPYVESVSASEVHFDYALMDEERVIGLKLDDEESRVTSIDVVQMGLP